jgi:hypothetical protein
MITPVLDTKELKVSFGVIESARYNCPRCGAISWRPAKIEQG